MSAFFLRLRHIVFQKLPISVRRVILKEISFKEFLTANKRFFINAGLVIILIIILIPIATYLYFIRDISSKDRILNRSNTGLVLMDKNGTQFFSFYQPKSIKYVQLSKIPVSIQHAVIAAEDKDFYTNQGVSIRGMLRAFVTDITTGHIAQGGSTITQELVKNALLGSQRTFLRKYQEAALAFELNRRYSKNDILELYLNSVYFGEGSFGIENAAEAYFGKHAEDLTLGESAMLTGILPAPSAYSPLSNDPTIAEKKEATVLSLMEEQRFISADEKQHALSEKLTFNPKREETNTIAPHFALYVKDILIKKYGEERIIRSGFRVKTTLNLPWQEYAETVVKNQIGYLKFNKATNGAAIAMDPKTGEIAVMVGSYDWNNEDFGKANMAIAPRQPGSSFKPIIYAKAMENHLITPATILKDDPITFSDGYKPLDYDKKFRGDVTVRRALSNSLNIPAVEVMQQVGVSQGIDFAKHLGISTLKDKSKYGLSLVLGAAEVPLLDMTDVYATFANQGKRAKPFAILEIRDKYNNLVDTFKPDVVDGVSDGTSYLLSSILSDNQARAEEFGGALTISRTAAVKTGTTENFRDALTIGYTPSLVVGVWVGNNDNKPMDNIAGSLGAAPIWRQMMEKFLLGTPVEQFTKPNSVVSVSACPYKNSTSKEATSSAFMEFFLAGTEKNNICPSPTPSPSNSPTPSPAPSDTPTETPIPSDTPVPTPTTILPTNIPTPTSILQTISSTPTPTP